MVCELSNQPLSMRDGNRLPVAHVLLPPPGPIVVPVPQLFRPLLEGHQGIHGPNWTLLRDSPKGGNRLLDAPQALLNHLPPVVGVDQLEEPLELAPELPGRQAE